MTSLCATASDTWVKNSDVDFIWYDFNEKEKTARVTFKGSEPSYGRRDYINDITIPSTVEYEGELYSVTSIGIAAFSNCRNLTEVVMPSELTSIGHWAFCGCHRLKEVIIPWRVTTIYVDAFDYCDSLSSITVLNTTPPKLVLNANEQIPHILGKSVSVYVPAESVEKYKSAEGWKLANIKDLSQKAEKKALKVKNSADAGKAEFLTDFLMILLIITFVFVFLLLRKKNA